MLGLEMQRPLSTGHDAHGSALFQNPWPLARTADYV